MGGEACGIGEGTHYGCECVMRRLAEAEARAAGLESALAVAGEENAALTESRDAALRALASEQARRETAERERDEERNRAEAYHDSKNGYRERMLEHGREIDSLRSSLSAALRRAEEAEAILLAMRHDLGLSVGDGVSLRFHVRGVNERAGDAKLRAAQLEEALRVLVEHAEHGECTGGCKTIEAARRALSVGVSRTDAAKEDHHA
jgi:chromosome segregation ATPase